MGKNFGPTDGFSTERDKICYAERARGGAAMIITEEWWSPAMRAIIGASLCSFDNRFIPGFADLRKALHHRARNREKRSFVDSCNLKAKGRDTV
jgi:dimethylglycine catabolism A